MHDRQPIHHKFRGARRVGLSPCNTIHLWYFKIDSNITTGQCTTATPVALANGLSRMEDPTSSCADSILHSVAAPLLVFCNYYQVVIFE